MNKFLKYGIALVGVSAAAITLVGYTSINNSKNNDENDSWNIKVEEPPQLPIATIKIENYGTITAQLYPHKAPNTVNNFIYLANSGFYDKLTFHRIIKGFIIQAGCPNADGTGSPEYSIKGEFSENGYKFNDLEHSEGVLSMARTNNPDSAGSQFFIMVDEAPHLNGKYAAFGKIIEGLDIAKKINSVETDSDYKPINDVVIEEIRVDTKGLDYSKLEKVN